MEAKGFRIPPKLEVARGHCRDTRVGCRVAQSLVPLVAVIPKIYQNGILLEVIDTRPADSYQRLGFGYGGADIDLNHLLVAPLPC